MSPILYTCVTVHLNFSLKTETLLEFSFKEFLPYSIMIGARFHLDVLKANRLYRLLQMKLQNKQFIHAHILCTSVHSTLQSLLSSYVAIADWAVSATSRNTK